MNFPSTHFNCFVLNTLCSEAKIMRNVLGKFLAPKNDNMDGAKVLLVLFFIARAPFVVCLAIDRPHFSEIVSLALQEQLHTYFSINEARK